MKPRRQRRSPAWSTANDHVGIALCIVLGVLAAFGIFEFIGWLVWLVTALEAQHYERGANDMRDTLAVIAEDALAVAGIETPAANGTATVLAEIVEERRRQIIAGGWPEDAEEEHQQQMKRKAAGLPRVKKGTIRGRGFEQRRPRI